MKKTFKIYPALFILSSNALTDIEEEKKKRGGRINHDTHDGYFKKGAPQTYYRKCGFNSDRTLITIHFSPDSVQCSSVLEFPETIFTKIEPMRYKGKHYTFTYVPIPN